MFTLITTSTQADWSPDDLRKFGDFLKRERMRAGLGLRQFAREIEVTPAYISRIERGRDNPPSAEILSRMESTLRITPGSLFVRARKVPPEFLDVFTKSDVNQQMLPMFMRSVIDAELTVDDWAKLIKTVEKTKAMKRLGKTDK